MSVQSITAATNAAPIVITTSQPHGLTTGDLVQIVNVGGNTAANGQWTVTVVNDNDFELDSSSGNGEFTSGGSVVKIEDQIGDPGITADYLSLKETTTTTGTGDITLSGAVDGFAAFMSLGKTTQVTYSIVAVDGSGNPTGDAEYGIGTFEPSTNTMSRDVIYATSTDASDPDPAVFDLQAGTKHVAAVVFKPTATSRQTNAFDPGPGQLVGMPEPPIAPMHLWPPPSQVSEFRLEVSDGAAASVELTPINSLPAPPQNRMRRIMLLNTVKGWSNASGFPLIAWQPREVTVASQKLLKLPFQINSTNLPNQGDVDAPLAYNTAVQLPQAGIPADVFAWTPAALTSAVEDEGVRLFRMVWYSATARNNGVSGAGRRGFDLETVAGPFGDVLALKTVGVNWLNEGSTTADKPYVPLDPGAMALALALNAFQGEVDWNYHEIRYKVPGRFLYLGTFVKHDANDNRIWNKDGKRCIWNQYNRKQYTDVMGDPTPTWNGTVVPATGSRMHPAIPANTSPWMWHVVQGHFPTLSPGPVPFRASLRVSSSGPAGIQARSDITGSAVMRNGTAPATMTYTAADPSPRTTEMNTIQPGIGTSIGDHFGFHRVWVTQYSTGTPIQLVQYQGGGSVNFTVNYEQ